MLFSRPPGNDGSVDVPQTGVTGQHMSSATVPHASGGGRAPASSVDMTWPQDKDEARELGLARLRALPRPETGSPITADEAAALEELMPPTYDTGASIRDLAEAADRCYGTVHRVLDACGVDLRARGGRWATTLTRRETEAVQGLADGLTQREIAARMNLSPQAVQERLARARARLGASGREDLIARARQLDLVR